ncbi:RNA-binding protein squid [Lepeophtheirus salmonis]|uniref:RNA-binding protein squid n=1 Tax=Lepeophtheirus salmonis TaxID=72036 RepID=C1BSD9_LEPSM|nr:RNA-binding protein squid-like [Lepeophtheirus salmonis]ACO11942.1 RNA-binding protein squid [Lepeophtheirus salmonis]
MSATEENMGRASSEDDRKLFVGGLPQEASENDLKEYFEAYGSVTSTVLKMDQMTGRSRGFAFVVFATPESLESVLEQEHVVKGKKVACKKATAKQGKVYVGKFLDGSITEEDIKSHFSQYGTVVEIQRPVDRSKNSEPKNFCFVTFDKEDPAEKLLKEKKVTLNGQEVEIKKVTIKPELSRGGGGGGAGGGRGRNNAPWAGYDPWGGGYDGSWGYGAPMNTPWAASYGSGWGGWSSGGSFGGGKLGAGTGGSGYRGGRGGSRGRNAPY